MTQFGKRNTIATQSGASRRPDAAQTNVSAALAVVKTGKVPAWTTFGPLRLVIVVLCTAAALWYVTATYAGEILRDHRLAGTWQTAYDLRAVDGSCRRIQLVITFCSAKIKSLAEPERAPVVSQFMMGFSSGGGEVMVPVRSTVNPSAVAIAYAAESKLVNRTLTWLVSATILAALLIPSASALLRGRYKGGRAHRSLLDGLAELQARIVTAEAAQRAAP